MLPDPAQHTCGHCQDHVEADDADVELVTFGHGKKRCIGEKMARAMICAFLGEGTVEFFLERLPVGDCLHQLKAGAENHVMAAINLWTK